MTIKTSSVEYLPPRGSYIPQCYSFLGVGRGYKLGLDRMVHYSIESCVGVGDDKRLCPEQKCEGSEYTFRPQQNLAKLAPTKSSRSQQIIYKTLATAGFIHLAQRSLAFD